MTLPPISYPIAESRIGLHAMSSEPIFLELRRADVGQRRVQSRLAMVRRQERAGVHVVYRLVSANLAELPMRTMCKVLKVSASGFYDWRGRAPCARAQANAALTERIGKAHADSDATYGMPRIRAELAEDGVVASKKRIAQLMRAAGLRGVSRRRGFTVTTRRIDPNGRGLLEITQPVATWAEASGIGDGLLTLFTHHTSGSEASPGCRFLFRRASGLLEC